MSIGFSNEGSALNPKPSPLNELLNLKRRPLLSGGVRAIEDKEKGRVGRERPDLSEMCSFGLYSYWRPCPPLAFVVHSFRKSFNARTLDYCSLVDVALYQILAEMITIT
jgi:hypothetical protein